MPEKKLRPASIQIPGMLYFKLETEALRIGAPVDRVIEAILKRWINWRETQQPAYRKGPPEGKFNR